MLSYQWRRNGVDIPGATGKDLILNNVGPFDNGDYSVAVTDANTTVISANANLLVLSPPTIVQQPQSTTEVAFMDVTFNVVVGGDGPFSYQWRFNGVNIIGATNNTLELFNAQPTQAGAYSVVVANPSSSVTSDAAILTLLIPASITQQPMEVTALPGDDVFFNVTATSSTPMTYQWRVDGVDIPNETNTTLNVSNVQVEDDGIYTVVVTDTVGSIESDGARLIVLVPPTFVEHPQSLTLVEGATLVLSVETAGTLPMGYRWTQDGVTRANDVSSSHSSFLIIENVDESFAGQYRVVITNLANSVAGGETDVTLIPRGANWKYLDNGSDQGTVWRELGFDDSSWAEGPAELGYGDGDEATVVSFGPDSGNKYVTTYFRHSFNVPDPSLYTSLSLDIKRDDGCIVYLNGVEIFRDHLTGVVNYQTFAQNGSAEENIFLSGDADPGLLVSGMNVIAVEMHQGSSGSSDISFNMDLEATALNPDSLSQIATVTVLADTDGDGLPDDWENANGLNPNDPADALLDPDMDSFSTVDEYITGTDHLDGNSFLKVDAISEAGTVDIHFTAVAGKTYTVQWAPTLDGPWMRLTDVPAGGTDRAVTVMDTPEGGAQRFYRLVSPIWVP